MYTTTLFLIGLFLVNSSNASTQSPDECVAGSCSKEFVEVQTECGPVQGKRFREQKHFGAKTVDVFEFRNIPYARPPVEELRWRPPVPLSRNTSKCWTGTLGYEQKSVACSQSNKLAFMLGNAEMSEDCLVLTVRTPVQPDPRKKLPVMVWIHGGAMVYGNNQSPNMSPDPEFSASMEVVVVSVNYRLNIFGFLSLKELWIESGPDRSYGNYGIMDQIEALRWVQRNIRQFGGDPDNVAIYGESGGATGVFSILSSPMAAGLFHKAIPVSGAMHFHTTHLEADKKYRYLIDATNCRKETDADTAQCLQQFDGKKLISLYEGEEFQMLDYHFLFPKNEPYQGSLIQILDPVVITTNPEDILPTGRNDKVELLIGTCAQEAGPMPIPGVTPDNITSYEQLKEMFGSKLDTFDKGLYEKVLKSYSVDAYQVPPHEITPQYVYDVAASDVLLSCATNYGAEQMSTNPDFRVSRFILSQPPSKENVLGHLNAAFHGWDTVVLYGMKMVKAKDLSAEDKNLISEFRGMFKDFLESRYLEQYRGGTTNFWAGSLTTKPGLANYHRAQCEMWKEHGLLKFSWGNLGK